MRRCIQTTLAFVLILLSSVQAQVNYTFSATTGTYSDISGGTSPTLTNPNPGTLQDIDEGYANGVPIGFSFIYNGVTYTTCNLNVNGFISFGAGFTTGANQNFHINNLSGAPVLQTNVRPIVAPLWDDLNIQNITNIKYVTTGSSPNRVFTVEWKNAKWRYDATSAVISFQVKLYETTNIVEFIYRQEAGSVKDASASIGITASGIGDDNFIALNNASASPTTSRTVSTTDISAKPATGQVYRFTPYSCAQVPNFKIDNYVATAVNFSWGTLAGISNYEYAVTASSTPPASGTATTATSINHTGLTAATTYYVHMRSSCGGGNFSPWNTKSFTTASNPASFPYSENFDGITPPNTPSGIRIQNVNGATTWTTFTDAAFAASGTNAIKYAFTDVIAGDDWFFLPGFNMVSGANYTLKFKYRARGSSWPEKLEVKYGNAIGASSMTSTAIFNNSNINSETYTEATVNFTVSSNGVYYIGFHCYSEYDKYELFVDDISFTTDATLPVDFGDFRAFKNGTQNMLVWNSITESNNTGFEIQRSIDGAQFQKIGFVATQTVNGFSNQKLYYSFADAKPAPGVNYYRLKQIDKDGKFSFSKVVLLKGEGDLELEIGKVFPNPSSKNLNLIINAHTAQRVSVVVSDLNGKRISMLPMQLSTGANTIVLPIEQLSTGNYYISVIDEKGGNKTIKPFIKQ